MVLFKLAFRNVVRNGRRSVLTASAIAVGATALVLFGGYTNYVINDFQTMVVQRTGHLSVFHSGYFSYGSGDPVDYAIDKYQSVIDLIRSDAGLKPMLRVVTPTVNFYGIAGNTAADTSKTFYGIGVVPGDVKEMLTWDAYNLFTRGDYKLPVTPLRDDRADYGVLGIGLARSLGLCDTLKLPDCPPIKHQAKKALDLPGRADLAALGAQETQPQAAGGPPRLDLLAATAGGAPNVMNMYVAKAEPQGAKEFDDAYMGLHIKLAQDLIYGRGEPKAVAIVVQLTTTDAIPEARAKLEALFAEHQLDLEVRELTELQPFYKQAIDLLRAIFTFIAVIMAFIVLVAVVNTMTIAVAERTQEIGTARAMGVHRSTIRLQFLIEGAILGSLGASVGLAVGFLIGTAFNAFNLTWIPPGNSSAVPLRVVTDQFGFILAIGCVLVLSATIAAIMPANRAARLHVVDALRHI